MSDDLKYALRPYDMATDGYLFDHPRHQDVMPPDGILYRVVALRNIPEHEIEAGEVGGFVAGLENLSQEHGCWVADNACVIDEARVEGDALVFDHAVVRDSALVSDSAKAGGSALISRHASLTHMSKAGGLAIITGDAWLRGYANFDCSLDDCWCHEVDKGIHTGR